jgi:uncharacterized protein YjgD (DUF1641 family)
MELKPMEKELIALNQKVDALTEQISLMAEQAEDQIRRAQAFEELKADLIPIGDQLVNLTIQELEEIGTDFELEDLFYLLKRALRNTNLILAMMDRFEALMGIADEVELLGEKVFSTLVEELDRLERSGTLANGGELLRRLSDGETLGDLNRALAAFQSKPEERPPSLFSLITEINTPEARRGLGRLVKVMQALGYSQGENKTNISIKGE